MNSRILAAAISLVCVCAPLLRAQSGDKARQVVDSAIAALGGERFLHMQTLIESGRVYSFFHDRISGFDRAHIYVEYLPEKPAKGLAVREREAFGKKQDYSYLFLPDQGWDITYRGARQIPRDKWDEYARNTENDILYVLRERHNEPGMTYYYVGRDTLLSSEVDVVDITDSRDRTIRVYFDRNTHFPIRETYKWFDPKLNYQNDEDTHYVNYRDAGGGVM
ncbi:MAG: hypothetical protein ACRD4O_01985, partial [Bryobacteraceae bacterium]